MKRCFRINVSDNVATVLEDIVESERLEVVGGDAAVPLQSTGDIPSGHKIALLDIDAGQSITKFGVPIGRAKSAIQRGDWVHLHNCGSIVDARSNTFDVQTGATTDTIYA